MIEHEGKSALQRMVKSHSWREAIVPREDVNQINAYVAELESQMNKAHDATGIFGVDEPMTLLESVVALRSRIAEMEAEVIALKQPLPDTIEPALESGDVWFCKVGYAGSIPKCADWPMRQAVQHQFALLTGCEAKFVFSGWGCQLTEPELAVVENRQPRTAPKNKNE